MWWCLLWYWKKPKLQVTDDFLRTEKIGIHTGGSPWIKTIVFFLGVLGRVFGGPSKIKVLGAPGRCVYTVYIYIYLYINPGICVYRYIYIYVCYLPSTGVHAKPRNVCSFRTWRWSARLRERVGRSATLGILGSCRSFKWSLHEYAWIALFSLNKSLLQWDVKSRQYAAPCWTSFACKFFSPHDYIYIYVLCNSYVLDITLDLNSLHHTPVNTKAFRALPSWIIHDEKQCSLIILLLVRLIDIGDIGLLTWVLHAFPLRMEMPRSSTAAV